MNGDPPSASLLVGAVPQAAAPGRGTAAALLASARPRQALKNVLVLAAPAAAGQLLDLGVLAQVAGAFAAFTLTASGLYLFNDVHDARLDRLHPRKASRPVASGRLSARTALAAGAVLVAAGLGTAALVGLEFLGVVAAYAAIIGCYITWARDVVVLDLAAAAWCVVFGVAVTLG